MNNILHIINDYSGSKVYKNLIKEIDRIGYAQTVYVPARKSSLIGNNAISFINPNSRIIYSLIINNHLDRIYYFRKINKLLGDINSKVDVRCIRFIHAHTWFSDGGVAYELSKRTGIPFMVTVRNTDLNVFYKYMFFLREHGFRILEHAKKIIFISKSYLDRFQKIML